MRFNVIWTEYCGPNQVVDYDNTVGRFRNVSDVRPTEIEADTYKILYSQPELGYMIGVEFIKDDAVVATLFQLPVAIIPVANVQE